MSDSVLSSETVNRLQEVERLANVGHWEWSLESDALMFSPQARLILGLAPDDVETPQLFFERIHPDDQPRVQVSLDKIFQSPAPVTLEYRIRLPDGAVRWVQEVRRASSGDSGEPIRVLATVTDIREQKQFADSLQRVEQLNQTLLSALPEQIAIVGPDGRIISINEAWGKATETGESGLVIGEPGENLLELCSDISPPLDSEALRALTGLKRVLDQGGKFSMEYASQNTGRTRWFSLNIVPLPTKGLIVSQIDITVQKELEAQFLRAQRMESVGSLASGVAHDLNNVLVPIIMSLEELRTTARTPDELHLLNIIDDCAKRGAGIVKQFLMFGRGLASMRVAVRPQFIISELGRIVSETFPKNIRFHEDTPPNLWSVQGDPTQLYQVFLNLCVNAKDAMVEGGHLTIEADNVTLDELYVQSRPEVKPGRYVVIRVTDSGCGIPEEIQGRIFEPLFTTKQTDRGTGLGLSTAMAIVKSHGGFMELKSEPGRGAQFDVYLPAHFEGTEIVPVERNTPPPRGRGETILVVDDEAAIRSAAGRALEAHDYRVITASDGADAVMKFALHHSEIAVVLVNMVMPVMDGPSTIHAIQRLRPEQPFIATSGRSLSSSASRLGVKHFLPKPFTSKNLLDMLGDVLAHD